MTADPDHGDADPAVVEALASGDPSRILEALDGARLLVGVIAMPGEEQASEGEMALALLESAGGEQALPAFTGVEAMRAWNADARPVPRPAREVIAYAYEHELAAVVIDPGEPHSQILWCEGALTDSAASPPGRRRWWRRG